MAHVLVLSGGLDSTVAAHRAFLSTRGSEPFLVLSFDYGQTHLKEIKAARAIAKRWHLPHEVVDLRGLLTGSALLGEGAIPADHYDDETMSATVVHARNMLFASVAVSRAGEGGTVTLGVHGGDHHLYPDCRPTFWEPYKEAVSAAYDVEILTPFIDCDKAEIVRVGHLLSAPLDLTWSCYVGGEVHCGECGTCRERREAFASAQVTDPTSYAEKIASEGA